MREMLILEKNTACHYWTDDRPKRVNLNILQVVICKNILFQCEEIEGDCRSYSVRHQLMQQRLQLAIVLNSNPRGKKKVKEKKASRTCLLRALSVNRNSVHIKKKCLVVLLQTTRAAYGKHSLSECLVWRSKETPINCQLINSLRAVTLRTDFH